MAKGRFITVEGGEGAGKSTQLAFLASFLRMRGKEVLVTREPGGAPGAEEIRKLLVDGAVGRWDGMSEMLLHFAARRDHLVRTVWPALDRGIWVLSDRFADSTMAYQGDGHGLALDKIRMVYDLVVGDFKPDLTLILDLPVEEGLRRAAQRGDSENRYERMGVSFHERLRAGFLEIARAEPERCFVIPATGDIESIRSAVEQAVEARLPTV